MDIKNYLVKRLKDLKTARKFYKRKLEDKEYQEKNKVTKVNIIEEINECDIRIQEVEFLENYLTKFKEAKMEGEETQEESKEEKEEPKEEEKEASEDAE